MDRETHKEEAETTTNHDNNTRKHHLGTATNRKQVAKDPTEETGADEEAEDNDTRMHEHQTDTGTRYIQLEPIETNLTSDIWILPKHR